MINIRAILYVMGIFLSGVGLAALVPAAFESLAGRPDAAAFIVCAAISLFLGGGMILAFRGAAVSGLNLREAFLLTPLCWIGMSAIGAIPLLGSGLEISYVDAFFESVAGLTTTGSTVLVGLDGLPPGILMWRSLLQWVGGIGIIVVAIAVLPVLQVGGMQLFRTESPMTSEKVLPRPGQLAGWLFLVYLGLTFLCFLAYWASGMTPFNAINHAMTTTATAGFSTSDASLGQFTSPLTHWVAIVFMLSGAIPFVLYVQYLKSPQPTPLWRDEQVQLMVAIILAAGIFTTLWLIASDRYEPADALRHGFFNVVSIVTTTGYSTTDYSLWGGPALGLFFVLTFIGGCSGSTSGGIKIFRWRVLWLQMQRQLAQLVMPNRVVPAKLMNRPLTSDVTLSVTTYVFLFFSLFGIFTLALTATGVDLATAVSGAATAIANVGPGVGPVIGPGGSFNPLPDAAKLILCFAMILGRLDLLTVLVLFDPRFWRS